MKTHGAMGMHHDFGHLCGKRGVSNMPRIKHGLLDHPLFSSSPAGFTNPEIFGGKNRILVASGNLT